MKKAKKEKTLSYLGGPLRELPTNGPQAELCGGLVPIELDRTSGCEFTSKPLPSTPEADSPASIRELNDSSYPPEMAAASSFPRRASTELLHPIHGKSGQCSLWDRIHRNPAIDRRCSTATQSQNDRNRNSSFVSASIRNSVPSEYSGNGRHSSDSSGGSKDSPQSENIVPLSLRPQPLDFDKELRLSPQQKPLPSLPESPTIPISPVMTSSSDHFPGTNYLHSLSSEPAVSHFDPRALPETDTDTLPYVLQTIHETGGKPNNQGKLCLRHSISPSVEIMKNRCLARKPSAEDQNHLGEPRYPNAFCDSISSSTLTPTTDSPAQDDLPPCPPGFGLSSPLSSMFPLTNTIANNDFPTSDIFSAVSAIGNCPESEIIEPYEAGAGNWVSLNSWPLEPVIKELDHRRSGFQTTNSDLHNQFPVSNGAISSEFGALWAEDDVTTVPYLQRKESFDLADSIHSNGVHKRLESGTQSSMINSTMTQLGTSKASNPVFFPRVPNYVPLTLGIYKDSSFTDRNVETTIADAPVPTLSPPEMNDHNQRLWKLSSPVSDSDQRYQHSAPLRRLQIKKPPSFCYESDISLTGNGNVEANVSPPSLEATRRRPAPGQLLTQCSSRDGHRISDKAVCSGNEFASPHESLFDLCNTLDLSSLIKGHSHCFEHGTLSVSHSPSKETLCEELQEMVGAVNSDWMDKLSSVPYLRLRCSVLSPNALFKNGIFTLKEFFCGRLAPTFEDLFALVHLAFATAFFIDRQQGHFCWDAFYNDAFQWQHLLTNDEDRVVFLKVMKPELWPIPSLHRNRLASLFDITSRESTYCGDYPSLLAVLGKGQLLKVCIGFLDCKSTFM